VCVLSALTKFVYVLSADVTVMAHLPFWVIPCGKEAH